MNPVKISGIIRGLEFQDIKIVERLCSNKKIPTRRISIDRLEKPCLAVGNAVRKLESVEKTNPDEFKSIVQNSAFWADTKPKFMEKLSTLRPKSIPGLWSVRNVDDKVLDKLVYLFKKKGVDCEKLYVPNIYEGYQDRFIAFGVGLKKANNLIKLYDNKKMSFDDISTIFHKSPGLAGKKELLKIAEKVELPPPVSSVPVSVKKNNPIVNFINSFKRK